MSLFNKNNPLTQPNYAQVHLIMADFSQPPSPSHKAVPKTPNLISKAHPDYNYFTSIARIEHRQVNDMFLAKLRQEQANDPWINEIKPSVKYRTLSDHYDWPGMHTAIRQSWPHAKFVMPEGLETHLSYTSHDPPHTLFPTNLP